MEGWIKLHRKALQSEVFNDPTAWRIFTWLLLKVDRKTGKKKIGRFWASKEVKLKPSTFYKGLMRLQNKYLIIKIVTSKVTIKYSEISLLNWNKYQSSNTSEEQSSNNPVTHKEQSSNTLQEEEENRELKNDDNVEPQYFKNKKTNPLIISKGQQMSYLKAFPTLTSTELKIEMGKCNTYMGMSSEQYKNPGLFFKKWLTKYMVEREQKRLNEKKLIEERKALEGLPEEQRLKNIERLDEIREQLKEKLFL